MLAIKIVTVVVIYKIVLYSCDYLLNSWNYFIQCTYMYIILKKHYIYICNVQNCFRQLEVSGLLSLSCLSFRTHTTWKFYKWAKTYFSAVAMMIWPAMKTSTIVHWIVVIMNVTLLLLFCHPTVRKVRVVGYLLVLLRTSLQCRPSGTFSLLLLTESQLR